MSYRRLRNIVLKEWQVIFTDVNSTLIVTLLPLLIVGQGVLYIWLAYRFGGEDLMGTGLIQNALDNLVQTVPSVAELGTMDQLRVLLLSQFSFFLLLVPAMVAISFATFSVVEEKLSGSLEPLLATPVRTGELLLGKALSGAIPALIATWVCAGVFLGATAALGWGSLLHFVLSPAWFLSLFLITPAIVVLSFVVGVIGSSRAKDAKSAQNGAVLVVLPVFAFIAVQVTGVVWFGTLGMVGLALGISAIDVILLRVAVRLFRRESIVVNWR
jgi:ABC-type multidrug transport system permease subunit